MGGTHLGRRIGLLPEAATLSKKLSWIKVATAVHALGQLDLYLSALTAHCSCLVMEVATTEEDARSKAFALHPAPHCEVITTVISFALQLLWPWREPPLEKRHTLTWHNYHDHAN
jgi:hypothetical protein